MVLKNTLEQFHRWSYYRNFYRIWRIGVHITFNTFNEVLRYHQSQYFIKSLAKETCCMSQNGNHFSTINSTCIYG